MMTYHCLLQIFCRLFDCVLLIALQDMLATEEEDLDEDIEDIETRNMDELLRGISLIGRSLALWNSIGHVRACLEDALERFEEIMAQTTTSKAPIDKWFTRESSRSLEIQRVCSMFLTHLCFEGAGLTSTGGAISTGDIGSSSSAASEIPVLPKYLTAALGGALLLTSHESRNSQLCEVLTNLHSEVSHTVSLCARSLDLQRQALSGGVSSRSNMAMLEKFEALQSPIVMQGWFEFFKEYIRCDLCITQTTTVTQCPSIVLY
jgi:hypothetical protein